MNEANGAIEAPAEFFCLDLENGDETAFKGTLGLGDTSPTEGIACSTSCC